MLTVYIWQSAGARCDVLVDAVLAGRGVAAGLTNKRAYCLLTAVISKRLEFLGLWDLPGKTFQE